MTVDPVITPEIISEHGISDDEYNYILEILGRKPSWVELGIFSVMWSEHASYKNSISMLKTLPRDGAALLSKAGEENAGVVDIGDGKAICFKIESHNHPSALEPYHGAATGVGGILRDIFTMGARPIAALNSLRFGKPNNPQVKHLLAEVVNGIADYGNCFGVPTVGGEIYFEDSYEGNPLVNAMAVGIVDSDNIAKSSASGPGNLVVYVGAKTGRDGIHGATFASVDLSEDSEEKRTAVQVGDPFYEKLLLEATLEVISKKLVVAIQDMGAAGLTCSSSEMSGKGGVGINLEVDLVPQRESGMTPYEIMLSESQERMLLIVEPVKIESVYEVFQKWDLEASVIGSVTDDGLLTIRHNGKVVAQIPSEYLILGGKAPVYKRDVIKPDWIDTLNNVRDEIDYFSLDHEQVLLAMLQSPNIASKLAVFRQYDHMVQINTHIEPGADAAVIAMKECNKAIALSTDCNGRYCYLDPYQGAIAAVAESARNVACVGARPIAITNCLNFGNPHNPDAYWQLSEAIRGMGDACRMFDTPVTGGNVSLYNENRDKSIYPTPVIGMLGIMDDYEKCINHRFKHEGDLIYLLGGHSSSIGGSEFQSIYSGSISGIMTQVNLDHEKKLQDCLHHLIDNKVLVSAHDCSDGGLVITVLECLLQEKQDLGAQVWIDSNNRKESFQRLYGEDPGRVIVSVRPTSKEYLLSLCKAMEIPMVELGVVDKSSNFRINNDINIPIEKLYSIWIESLTI